MKRWIVISTLSLLILLAAGAVVVWAGAGYLSRDLPPVDSIRQLQLSVPLRIVSADGKLIGQFGAERRSLLRYDDIPPNVIHAFLAAEDDRFFEHPGVDWQGLVRASFVLALSGQKSQGGSTITMQLARNVFLSNERTFTRKFKEILLALRIEHELSKKEILELYLNKIFLGERAYGVGAASLVYFGKDIHELTLGEAATIAGLPKAPSRDNPIANPQRAHARRDYVLARMHGLGYISDAEYQAARAEPDTVHPYQARVDVDAPYAAEMARAWAVERYGDDAYTRGLTVITTVDARKQQAATAALRKALLDYDERHGWRGPEAKLPVSTLSSDGHAELAAALDGRPVVANLRVAVVASYRPDQLQLITLDGPLTLDKDAFAWANLSKKPLSPGDVVRIRPIGAKWRLAEIPTVQGAFVGLRPVDGAIQALVGGFDFYANKFNRALQAKRQAGSGFKPFLYAAGLAQGLTPASVFLDAPVVVNDPSADTAWRPQNFEGDLKGPMSLREALVHSRNLVSIRLLQAIGIDYTRDYVPRFGLPADRLPNNLTMALGTAVFTPMEMARGYATIANGGFMIDPYLITEVRDVDGKSLYTAAPKHACVDCSITASGAADAAAGSAPASRAPDASTGDANLAPRTIDPQVDWLIADMMHDVAVRGTGAKTNELRRNDLAGKTGTTNDETDAWFNGFQSTQVAIAWVGFDQPAPLGAGEVGARAALPIWIDYMRVALDGVPQSRLPRPSGLVDVRIDPRTGKLASADTPGAVFEVVQQEHVPQADADPAQKDPNKADLEDLY